MARGRSTPESGKDREYWNRRPTQMWLRVCGRDVCVTPQGKNMRGDPLPEPEVGWLGKIQRERQRAAALEALRQASKARRSAGATTPSAGPRGSRSPR